MKNHKGSGLLFSKELKAILSRLIDREAELASIINRETKDYGNNIFKIKTNKKEVSNGKSNKSNKG